MKTEYVSMEVENGYISFKFLLHYVYICVFMTSSSLERF